MTLDLDPKATAVSEPGARSIESGYIPTLDGWRAIAISAVIASHSQATIIALGWSETWIFAVLGYGRLGVDLFFAISGYLICGRLLHEYRARDGIRLRQFYLRRIFRIMPLYYGYLIVLAVLGLTAGVPVSRAELAASGLFLRNYFGFSAGGYTGHFWSLAVEEHFYLVWPPLLALIGPTCALWVVPALALGVHAWRSLDARWHLFPTTLSDAGILHRTDTRIDAILWGCFAALICFRYPTVRMPRWSAWGTLAVLIGAVVCAAPALPLVLALFFPVLVVSTAHCSGGVLARLLEWGPLRWLGRLSYSLYVWQTLFLQTSPRPDPVWLVRLKQPPLDLAMILACAITSHYLLERPMIQLGRKLAARSRREAASDQIAVRALSAPNSRPGCS